MGKIRRLLVGVLLLALAATAPAGASTRAASAGVFEEALTARIAAAPDASLDALVTVRGGASMRDVARVRAVGVHVMRLFEDFGVLYVAAPAHKLLNLASVPGVVRVVENAKLVMAGDTATVATRARELWDTKSTSTTPMLDGSGNRVDGRGIGIAVVDSGVDGTHPDLAPAMAGNLSFICGSPGLIQVSSGRCYANGVADSLIPGPDLLAGCSTEPWAVVPNSDPASGHGTHVAGIVAGRGTASDGRLMGAAPGASLYGLGLGAADGIYGALEGLQWVNCYHNAVVPRIRIATNSWGGPPGAFVPTNPINVAVSTLVGNGVTVLFAAGNAGGTGAADTVNPYAKNPLPGVISVGNYVDAGTATRTGSMATSSSRGITSASAAERGTDWPDVAAPGSQIISTIAKSSVLIPTTTGYSPYYGSASGTSMATPHVAGIAAMLLQINPALTPAQIEDILEDTAVPIASAGAYLPDPSNPTTDINHVAGHGLVDARAAATLVGGTGGSTLPQISQNPHAYLNGMVDGVVVSGLQWTVPAGVSFSLSERFMTSGGAAWPISTSSIARFRITGPGCTPCFKAAPVTTDSSATSTTTALRMDSDLMALSTPGTYRIESQILWGSFISFDSFVLRVV